MSTEPYLANPSSPKLPTRFGCPLTVVRKTLVRRVARLSIAVWLLATSMAFAQETPASAGIGGRLLADSASGSRTVGNLLEAMQRSAREKVLNLDSASPALLFPVIGKIPYWTSDVMLINNRTVPQRVAFLFLQEGVNNVGRAPLYYTLPAQFLVFWNDFFGTGLGMTGIGTIVVTGVDSAGNPDTAASLDGAARLYQTNSAGGTLSQNFPAVSVSDVPAGARTTAVGLRSDVRFRTNAGAVNLDSVGHSFNVSIVSVAGVSSFSIAVPPYSMMQVPLPNQGAYGNLALQFTSDSGTWWSAYGACVDNISGDSWSAHAALAF